jgi:hypothetical protein
MITHVVNELRELHQLRHLEGSPALSNSAISVQSDTGGTPGPLSASSSSCSSPSVLLLPPDVVYPLHQWEAGCKLDSRGEPHLTTMEEGGLRQGQGSPSPPSSIPPPPIESIITIYGQITLDSTPTESLIESKRTRRSIAMEHWCGSWRIKDGKG